MGIVLFLLSAWFAEAHSKIFDDCSKFIGTCDYYLCKESNSACGAEGYYLEFGYRYCQKFETRKSEYSAGGQTWLSEVKACLQQEIENSHAGSCREARSVALSSHVTCYERTNYCELSFWDKYRVYSTVNEELEYRDFAKIAFRIAGSCFTFEEE